ncbi:MAG TPA: hypothetical protein VHO06_06455 [Polyangia bacterium]|nr:hypothetical protein [Polyangia bacterium]
MMLRLMIVAGGALALASCGQDGPTCPAVSVDPQIQVPASDIAPAIADGLPPINAATTAAPAGVMVSIAASQGTVSYGGRGPFPAFIYDREDGFPTSGSVLYSGLGVEDGTWYPFWLYCTSDGRLTDLYGEMSDRDADIFPALEGTCTDQGVGPMNAIAIPAHTLSPIALTCGFTASAPAPDATDLMGSSVGSTYFLGDLSSVYPFHTVDCRDCGSPGWYEVHSIIWDPAQQVAAFSIFYLDDQGLSLGAGIALPTGASVRVGTPISGATFSIGQ